MWSILHLLESELLGTWMWVERVSDEMTVMIGLHLCERGQSEIMTSSAHCFCNDHGDITLSSWDSMMTSPRLAVTWWWHHPLPSRDSMVMSPLSSWDCRTRQGGKAIAYSPRWWSFGPLQSCSGIVVTTALCDDPALVPSLCRPENLSSFWIPMEK
jgi:hypothetical protein